MKKIISMLFLFNFLGIVQATTVKVANNTNKNIHVTLYQQIIGLKRPLMDREIFENSFSNFEIIFENIVLFVVKDISNDVTYRVNLNINTSKIDLKTVQFIITESNGAFVFTYVDQNGNKSNLVSGIVEKTKKII